MAALLGHLFGVANNIGENEVRNWIAGIVENSLNLLGYNRVLGYVQTVFHGADDNPIQSLTFAIAKRTLVAMRAYLGPAPALWDLIMNNEVNKDIFKYIQQNWSALAEFFVDLLEPTKRFCKANSTDGETSVDGMKYNTYNEMDLTVSMNRHAVICQLQRVAKSITQLFGKQNANLNEFMDTELDSDAGKDITEIPVLKRAGQTDETWLYVNGIVGEAYWQALALKKLRDYFFDDPAKGTSADTAERGAVIKAIFNRSDGLLWDLIECAGERRPDGVERGINQRTQSSLKAQKALTGVLEKELREGNHDIFMLAHSQGCLLLRLSLEELIASDDEGLKEAMKDRLLAFTFGNPSYDWEVHKNVKRTEHFANREDFVAKLGVLRFAGTLEDPYHCDDCANRTAVHGQQLIFVNKERKGHLFGAQYCLDKDEYSNGESSWLLGRARWNGV
ncbi:hypothetical protein LTR17_002152 [Elasticomyces elasticus]|nr:hypothetical protein LTR17_002152 [Elasticomyces elasticus]